MPRWLLNTVTFVVLMLPNVAAVPPSEKSLAVLVKKDVLSTVSPFLVTRTASKVQCAVHCLRNSKCLSFTFGSGYCRLMEEIYDADDPTLVPNNGYSYYSMKNLYDVKPPPELVLSQTLTDFDTAQKECEKLNEGRLVCIHDHEMQTRVAAAISQNNENQDTAWIGLKGTVQSNTDYDLKWVNGKTLKKEDYNNFHPTDPNGNGFNCVAISAGLWLTMGDWVDDECSNNFRYVCEYQPGSKENEPNILIRPSL